MAIQLGNKLVVKELDLKSMCEHPSIMIISKRGGGKTWICRHLLDHFRSIPAGVIISHSERVEPFYQEFFPDSHIYNEYTPKIFQKILQRQVSIREKAEMKKKQGKFIDTRLLLLMDDCLSSCKTWARDEALKEILFNGRHLDITYILTMQEPMAIIPELRSNFDYIFLLHSDVFSEIKKFYDHYVGTFPNFNAFREVYDRLTMNFGSLVCKKRSVGGQITDKIFHFKAIKMQPKMIGCTQMKKFFLKNYDKNWKQKMYQNKFNLDTFIKKKSNGFDIEKVDMAGKPMFD